MKKYQITLYVCGCGYETTKPGNASKHKKVACGHEISPENKTFVLESEHLQTVAEMKSTSVSGERNNTIIGSNNSQVNVTINLTVPEKSVVSSIYDAIKIPECIDEIRYADPQQIPAILFKYTRGVKAEQQVIKYDPDKDVVRHKDPVTGREVSKDLKKYRNEYLAKNADVYDDDFHIPYMPPQIQKNMKELSTPQYESGKKKDAAIPGAAVIKMCATGDHRMYKLPHESKQFYTDVAANVDHEIKITGKDEPCRIGETSI